MTAAALPNVTRVEFAAPLRWLAQGWSDFMKAFAPSVTYGALIAALCALLFWYLVQSDLAFWAVILSCGFVFVAPLLAMGLYEAGRALERGEQPRLAQMLFVRQAVRGDVFYLGFALLLIYFLWGRIAQIVYGLSTYRLYATVEELTAFALNTPEGHIMLIWGAIIGGVMAFFTFALVVVSAPMLLNSEANVFGAIFTSLRATTQNFAPMLFWAVLITVLLIVAATTWFIALVVIFPWLGLASWRAYRELVVHP